MQTVGAEAVICRSCFRALSQVEAAAACGGFSAGRGPVAVGGGVWEWSRGVGLPLLPRPNPRLHFCPVGPSFSVGQWPMLPPRPSLESGMGNWSPAGVTSEGRQLGRRCFPSHPPVTFRA